MKVKIKQDYAELRKQNYPPLEELADALVKEDEEALAEYKRKCLEVKRKFPKT